MKASWVKRILKGENKDWNYGYFTELDKFGGNLLFQSNLNEKHIKHKIKNLFLKDIVCSWAKVNFKQNPSKIIKQIIWNNSFITLNGNTLFYKKWLQKGIIYIHQIYNLQYHRFLTFQELTSKYRVENCVFFKYHSLVSNIPNAFKEIMKTELNVVQEHEEKLYDKIMILKKPNQTLYKTYLKVFENGFKSKSEEKWKIDFDNLSWKHVYSMPFKCTIDSKLRIFQYKYLTRIIPTNTYLYKCKLASSNLCDFCNMHMETLKHMYWECSELQVFWTRIKNFLNSKNITFDMNFKTISFGIIAKSDMDNILNFIIILAKYFIFKSKMEKCVPKSEAFFNYINERKPIEEHIALMKDKLHANNRKWSLLS